MDLSYISTIYYQILAIFVRDKDRWTDRWIDGQTDIQTDAPGSDPGVWCA